jgi:hypothetical protein
MKYYLAFIVSFISVLLALPAYNYVVDWYGVFQGVDQDGNVYIRKRPEHSSPAENAQHPYLRFSQALEFVKSFDGKCMLVLGSSRVGTLFSDAEMSSLFGVPVSKLQYNGSPIEEALHNVKLLAHNKAVPQRLIIGIDDFSLFSRGLRQELNRMPPPLGVAQNYMFWKAMLYRWPSMQNLSDSIGHAAVAYKPLSSRDGRAPVKKINNNLYLLSSVDTYQGRYYVDEAIQDVKDILSIAKAHDASVDFFITPRFVSTYYMRDHESLHEFKRKLAGITPFYDFSGVVYENISPRFWLETSHQTNEVGLIISDLIKSGGSSGLWGRLVNKDNVEDHLRDLKNNLINNVGSWLLAKPDGDIHPKLYSWLFPRYKSSSARISSVSGFNAHDWHVDGQKLTLTSKSRIVTIEVPSTVGADRLQFSVVGAPRGFYTKERSRRYVDLFVNGVPYGHFMFGMASDDGAISNEKTITVLGDFSQGATLEFVVQPEKLSADEEFLGLEFKDTFDAIYTGNHLHAEAVSFEFSGALPASKFSKPSPLDAERLARNKFRLESLGQISSALEEYKNVHKSYPVSSGWNGLYSRYGTSSPDWIPGLAPEFIDKLPRDPRNNSDDTQQYLYQSNGRDYKLIAHGVDSFAGVGKKFVDPRRPSSAFGVWTKEAASW